VSKNNAPLSREQKVTFVTEDSALYYGVVQRVTGNLVTVRATGLLHQAKGPLVGILAPNSVHVVPRTRVTPVA
jgi:hypothetical protein